MAENKQPCYDCHSTEAYTWADNTWDDQPPLDGEHRCPLCWGNRRFTHRLKTRYDAIYRYGKGIDGGDGQDDMLLLAAAISIAIENQPT